MEAIEPPPVRNAHGVENPSGKRALPRGSEPGTARAQPADVDTLAWGQQPPPSRWALATGIRPVRRDLRQGPLVLTIFLVTQCLDGLLTYWGVLRFGIDIEMNTLLATLMQSVGPAAALFAAKALACACGLLLYANAYLRPLAVVAGLCLGLAVIPWIVVVTWMM
jgi:hypothetical protein